VTVSVKVRAALLLLRLAILGAMVLGFLLGDAQAMQPWLIAGATLFIGSLVMSLLLALVERRRVRG
jgi:hypothetical protein